MVVTSTTDSIDVLLGAASTNPVHVTASYNQSTSSSVTPVKNVTTVSGTTPVNIVPAPSSGNSNQLRYCNIFNSDVAQVTVTVRMNYNGTTRNVITVTLQVNDYLQYTYHTGWKVFDMDGALKTTQNGTQINLPIGPPHYYLTSAGLTAQIAISTTQCVYMGKAFNSHKNISIAALVAQAAVTVTWAEAAIYKGTPSIGTAINLTRCGFVDIDPLVKSSANANRGFFIQVSEISPGDDLWFVVGNSATTTATLRANNVSDDVGAGFAFTAGTSRPSTNATLTGTAISTGNIVRFTWMGD